MYSRLGKIIKRLLFLSCCLLVFAMGFAQDKAITIGDTVPPVRIERILNFPSAEANLEDFRGKLVILDFWSTWCSSCIAKFPKLDSLQRSFGEEVLILPVTFQDEKRVVEFWQNNRNTKDLSFPMVVGDTAIHALFPHSGVPHVVWIGKDGVVKAITNGEYLKGENIQAVLDNKEIDWPVQVPFNTEFDPDSPLVASSGNGSYGYDVLNHSVLTGYIKGMSRNFTTSLDSSKGTVRYYAINNSIIDLANIAMRFKLGYYTKNRIVFKGTDSSRYYYDKKFYRAQWLVDNTYCYETVLPITTTDEAMAGNILQDLNKFLDIDMHIEKRMTECWILKRKRQALAPLGLGRSKEAKGMDRSISLGDVMSILNTQLENLPFINETDLDENTMLDLKIGSWTDVGTIGRALGGQGIDMVKEVRNLEMLVIRPH